MKITATTALVMITALQTGTMVNTGQLSDSKEWPTNTGATRFTYSLAAACPPIAETCSGSRKEVTITGWSWASYNDAGNLFRGASQHRVTPGAEADSYAEPGRTQAPGLVDAPGPTASQPQDTHERYVVAATLNSQDKIFQGLGSGRHHGIEVVNAGPEQPLNKGPKYSGLLVGQQKPTEFRLPIAVLLFGTGLIALAGLILKRKKTKLPA